MKKIFIYILTSIICIPFLSAQEECTDRYQKVIFSGLEFDGNVDYESWAKYNGGRVLRYDVYMPKGDTASLRPLIVLWHGGAFIDLIKKNSPDITRLARDLAKSGYVVITPDYRGMTNLTGFGNEEEIIKVVVGSTLDANDAFCHIFSQIENGNPYRIDKNQIFSGGVSAGSIIGLHGLLLENTDQLGEKIASYSRKIDNGRIDEVLANKFCGNSGYVKAFFNVSGAMIDTSFINHTDIRFMHIHGTKDDFVPFDYGQPLWGLTASPDLYGSKPIHEKLVSLGVDSEFLVFEGDGHVPYLNIKFDDLTVIFNLINEEKYQYCLQKILDFLFVQINCETKAATPTPVRDHISNEVKIHPNPSYKNISISLPQQVNGVLEIFEISGKKVFSESWNGQYTVLDVSQLNDGMYLLQISPKDDTQEIYIHKFIKSKN